MTTENQVTAGALFGGWGMRVIVCGEDCGIELNYPTRADAEDEAKERTSKYGVLGCSYRVVPPPQHCKCCLEKGQYVRTRIFEGGHTSDVYACANKQCRSAGLLWHFDLPSGAGQGRPAPDGSANTCGDSAGRSL